MHKICTYLIFAIKVLPRQTQLLLNLSRLLLSLATINQLVYEFF